MSHPRYLRRLVGIGTVETSYEQNLGCVLLRAKRDSKTISIPVAASFSRWQGGVVWRDANKIRSSMRDLDMLTFKLQQKKLKDGKALVFRGRQCDDSRSTSVQLIRQRLDCLSCLVPLATSFRLTVRKHLSQGQIRQCMRQSACVMHSTTRFGVS